MTSRIDKRIEIIRKKSGSGWSGSIFSMNKTNKKIDPIPSTLLFERKIKECRQMQLCLKVYALNPSKILDVFRTRYCYGWRDLIYNKYIAHLWSLTIWTTSIWQFECWIGWVEFGANTITWGANLANIWKILFRISPFILVTEKTS